MHAVSQYIEYGDWTVREAIDEMEERVWLRYWTKANEMEGLVRATARLQRMEERAEELRERVRQRQMFGVGGELGLGLGAQNPALGLDTSMDVLGADYVDEESDEDDDLLSLSDEFGLREMIFQDWARNRILEGEVFVHVLIIRPLILRELQVYGSPRILIWHTTTHQHPIPRKCAHSHHVWLRVIRSVRRLVERHPRCRARSNGQ